MAGELKEEVPYQEIVNNQYAKEIIEEWRS